MAEDIDQVRQNLLQLTHDIKRDEKALSEEIWSSYFPLRVINAMLTYSGLPPTPQQMCEALGKANQAILSCGMQGPRHADIMAGIGNAYAAYAGKIQPQDPLQAAAPEVQVVQPNTTTVQVQQDPGAQPQ